MVDHLKARLDKIRKFSDSAKRRASLYVDMAKFDGKSTAQSLGCVQRASAPGKKLQKIGFIIFWIPEPTGISNAVAAPMILAGRYLDKKYNGATIHDIGHETKSTISTINDFKSTVLK
ncbi:MAG: hypothetical protein HC944_01745 [Nanoarchaeota archaeon]|nr:hypothetical protein [Nanoarchaeota archaeon]